MSIPSSLPETEPPEPYLIDSHPMLRNAVIMTRNGKAEWFLPRTDFEAIAKERDDLKRTLTLVNVALRIHDPRIVKMDPGKILDAAGFTFELAQAAGGIILDAQSRVKR